MSFFDDLPKPEPPQSFQRPKHQPWQGPEPGWVGGWVPWRVLLLKTADVFIMLREFEAHPTGLHFSLVTASRPDPTQSPQDMLRSRVPMLPGYDGPRLGVLFADGRKAVLGTLPMSVGEEPDGPVLRMQGGGGGGSTYRQGMWLWPLPPPGPLTWVASWEQHEAAEQSVVIDASVLEGAALEAEQLWDVPDFFPTVRTTTLSGSLSSSVNFQLPSATDEDNEDEDD